jgi:hypothetical protein
MKTLKIKPKSVSFEELAQKSRTLFGTQYKVTDNKTNEVTIAKTDTIGCKVILTRNRIIVNGTFATAGKMLLALGILIIGGIVIPMAIYLIAFKDKFEAIEQEVLAQIQSEFSEVLL